MTEQPFVLICDDSPSISQSLVFFLQRAGYRTAAVSNALECVAVSRKDPPDMIIMDIMLPGMDGALASDLMRELPGLSGVPIMLLSAMPEDDVKTRAEEAGVAGYLLKPFRKNVLLDRVKRCLTGVA